jgi:uncharacterized membrane protein
MDTGKSALGIEGNLAAALGYPIGIIAIISLVMEKENRFVKFHALQAVLLYVGWIVLMIAFWIIAIILTVVGVAASAATNNGAMGGLFGGLLSLVGLIIGLAFLIGIILAAVKAYQGQEFKLPVIGNMAANFANK